MKTGIRAARFRIRIVSLLWPPIARHVCTLKVVYFNDDLVQLSASLRSTAASICVSRE